MSFRDDDSMPIRRTVLDGVRRERPVDGDQTNPEVTRVPPPRGESLRCPPLSRVLAYRNAHVIERFLAKYRISRRRAQTLFADLLRFLWLGARACTVPSAPRRLAIVSALMDEMWHTFILHTRDYERFCHRFFGQLVHHVPELPSERPSGADALRAHRRQVAFVYDELGETVVTRWYDKDLDRSTPEFVEERRIPAGDGHRRPRPARVARARQA